MNWKIGQKLVCISSIDWFVGEGPKKDEVVTLKKYGIGFITGRTLLNLEEYDPMYLYSPEYFRPLLGGDAKEELISSFKEVTETSDMPIQIPETA